MSIAELQILWERKLYGDEYVCECCGHDPADCLCPECHVCHQRGEKDCYTVHGLEYTREQLIGQAVLQIIELREQIREEERYIDYLRTYVPPL